MCLLCQKRHSNYIIYQNFITKGSWYKEQSIFTYNNPDIFIDMNILSMSQKDDIEEPEVFQGLQITSISERQKCYSLVVKRMLQLRQVSELWIWLGSRVKGFCSTIMIISVFLRMSPE
ncbi:hypothetical protein TNIN_433941 [Trichonephila inaurata madagascariensis]|uniref:Uncharacterized protein n=1 Tax=Trichonephila inaurata madagascariensis TaxID=2747483 RepID=A0A8X7C6U7_9ARAC|nr:hypothetical protein TNIN_433941 [Trichonephila inaurata madagascariensis]